MYIMQKSIFKIACTFMLVLFVMSVTGAAATCSGGSCSAKTVTAKPDTFKFSPTKKSGNVLSNDKGTGLKVTTTGYIKTSKGSKVYMKSNGAFSYYPKGCAKTGTLTESFNYKVVNKYGKSATAKVTIIYKCK
jgi:hypothetical protein